jgi:hypothetical protein
MTSSKREIINHKHRARMSNNTARCMWQKYPWRVAFLQDFVANPPQWSFQVCAQKALHADKVLYSSNNAATFRVRMVIMTCD